MQSIPCTPPAVAPHDGGTAPTAATVAALRDELQAQGYDAVIRLHAFELAPRWLERSIRQTLRHAPAATRDLLQLFFLGDGLPARCVDGLLGAGLAAALRAGGLLDDSGDETRARHRIEVVGDHLVLAEWPSARAGGVYFGEDSQFLRSMLQPRAGDACLDLCTGTGVQALRCAERAARVDAVDLNPAAVRLARLNALLNGQADRVTVHGGDLWEPFPADQRWDYIVCNPPLVPVPEAVPYPLCGHGGADGLALVGRILKALPARLAPDGRCMLIGACTGTASRPAILDQLERHVSFVAGVTLFLLLRMALRDWVHTLGETVGAVYPGASSANTVLRCRTRYGAAFDDTVVYTWLASIDRGTPPGCRVFDYSTVGQRSYWFVNRGRVAP